MKSTLLRAAMLAALLPVGPLLAASEGGPSGSVEGLVIDIFTQQRIPGARIQVEGTTASAVADAEGRFLLAAVPVGTHRLTVEAEGYQGRVQPDIVVRPDRGTPVTIYLEGKTVARSEEVVVTASAFNKPPEVTTSSYGLSYEEIRRSPGSLGDVSRLVQSLPGVVIANDQRNDIIARGGSPSENLMLVDGVEMPTINHFGAQGTTGGPISMLNNEFVQDATFLAGGFPASYGHRLSSVLDIRLREGSRERFQSELDVSFAGAGLAAEGPLADKGSWMASVRQSYLSLLAGPFGIEAVPYYTNYQIKGTYEAGPRDKLSLISLGGRDSIKFEVDQADLEDPSLETIDNRGWRTVTGLTWQRLLGDQGFIVSSLSDAYSRFSVEIHDAQLGDLLTVRNRSREGETTLRAEISYRLESAGDLKAGVYGKLFRSTFEVSQPLGAENPYSSTRERDDAVEIDRHTSSPGVGTHVQWGRGLGNRLRLTVGGRLDHFDAIAATAFSPRAGLTLALAPRLDLNAGLGRYHQQPALVFVNAHPRNAALEPMRADHYVVGLSYLPKSNLKVTLEAYQKNYSRYPVSLEHPTLSLANTGDFFGVNDLLFPMVSQGTGRSRGIEFYVQKKLLGPWYGQVSYSYSRTEHAALDDVRRRGSFDIPHVGTAILGFKPSAAWEVSSRFTYASGRPYTPPLLSASTAQNRLVLDLSQVNAVRAPAYHKLDARLDRRFTLGRLYVTLNLELQNVYNRANVFQYVWNPKTNALFAEKQIEFLPVFGVNLKF